MQIVKTIEEMLSDGRDKLVIDVRDKSEFDKSTYPGAANIPWAEFL